MKQGLCLHNEHMNKTTYLGEFEHMILLAILRLADYAYGIPVPCRIAEGTTCFGAFFTTESTPVPHACTCVPVRP